MRIIAKKSLVEFIIRHPDSKQALLSWFQYFKSGTWSNANELMYSYPAIRKLDGHRLLFNIKGNKYRLIADFDYIRQRIYINFIGTHAEYDRINPNEVNLY